MRQGNLSYAVRAVSLAAEEDLAVLQVQGLSIEPPHRAGRPALNARVLVAGATQHGTFTGMGVVAAPPLGVGNAGRYVTARLPAMRGFSGAPVVDASGHLVGIIVSAVLQQDADLPELTHRHVSTAIDHRTVFVIPNDVLDAVMREEAL